MGIQMKKSIKILIFLITFFIGISLVNISEATPAHPDFKDDTFYSYIIQQ